MDQKEMFNFIGMVAIIVIGIAISVFMHGYVLSLLWLWFVVPTFALSEISVIQAAGLVLIIGFLTIIL